jgi:predicted nucleic acid-binding protein
VTDWLCAEVAWVPAPGDRHAEILGSLIDIPIMSSRLVSDAHLAALAIEHGLTVCSTDGDFSKFPGLKWHNPLAATNSE